MELVDILRPDRVAAGLRAPNKKQLLERLAQWAARETDCPHKAIATALAQRERLGTTGVGHGVAIPHARLDGVAQAMGFFARLDPPVDFLAIDGQPVNLLFLLLTPADSGVEHLKALASVSRVLRNPRVCERLRGADTPDALYALLTGSAAPFAA